MADFPEDVSYTPDHEWVKAGNESVVRIGITAYAAETMGDIVFVSLPEVGDSVDAHDSVAEVESTKSVAEVFCPVSGVIARVNEAVADAPETVNADPYGAGWLFEVELSDPGELDELLDVGAYTALLGPA